MANVPEVPSKSPQKPAGAHFDKADGDRTDDFPSVSPGKGGVTANPLTGCNSKRAAENVKQYGGR